MKVEGLGDERRNELYQVQAFVEQVEEFSVEHFKKVVNEYEKSDVIKYKVLTEATKAADENYTKYLNKVLVGGKMATHLMGIQDLSDEGTAIGKAMGLMRLEIKNDKEYRKQFLGPQIGKQIQAQEIQMRKIQKEEIKRQKQEMRALAKVQKRGLGHFNFGL